MRKRLSAAGALDGFAEHEILEMLLFYVLPRRDTNALAHELINKFGSVKGVLSASEEELTHDGALSANAAVSLRFFGLLTAYAAREDCGGIDVRDYNRMLEYVGGFFINENKEKFKVFCINSACRVQSVFDAAAGGQGSVTLNFKDLTRIVLNSGCDVIILAHNHPDAPNTPSQEDIAMTRKLITYLSMLDITVLDHYIIGRNGIMSMRSCGLIHPEE